MARRKKRSDSIDDFDFCLDDEDKPVSVGKLHHNIETTFHDLVLGESIAKKLYLILRLMRTRRTLARHGMKRLGSGCIGALFYGAPGVGKTASAMALASSLGSSLLKVDYATCIQKSVGDTEKNIRQAFATAREHEAILFWDEADALLIDREKAERHWEISQVAVFMQAMDEHNGLVILASNFAGRLDKAMRDRIWMSVQYPIPNGAQRKVIWAMKIPDAFRLGKDVDIEQLMQYRLNARQIERVIEMAVILALDENEDATILRDTHLQEGLAMLGNFKPCPEPTTEPEDPQAAPVP